jgi:serine/threonine protein kinase
MIDSEIVSGQQFAWCLNQKLGEGDAGEVYRVEALIGGKTAILKRPRRSAFSGDLFRQTAQIRTEAKILKALSTILEQNTDLGVKVPALIDQGKPGTDYNGRYFMVIEQAAGLDLSYLARTCQLGLSSQENPIAVSTPDDQAFLASIAKSGKIPNYILITILNRIIALMEQIHSQAINDDGVVATGIVWNDVKTDHLFWDPQHQTLTIIDWGNARFLDADRTTTDRKISWVDDFRQFYDEIGRFLGLVAPELKARLEWPVQFSAEYAGGASLDALKFRLLAALQEEGQGVAEIRTRETELLQSGAEGEASLAEIEELQGRILAYGEVPDYGGALRFSASYATHLAMQDRLEELRSLCAWANRLPGGDSDQWRLIEALAKIPGRSEGDQRQAFLDAIQAGICKDWESLLWKVAVAIQDFPEPAWWHDLTLLVRRLALGPEAETLRPLVALNRFMYSIQAAARRLEDSAPLAYDPKTEDNSQFGQVQTLARRLREEVIANWTQLEPGPPDSGLEYTLVDMLLAEARSLLPGEQHTSLNLLSQPKAQVKRILEAWDKKDFLEAGKGLRRLLLWDPDRRRVLHADWAIRAAPDYLTHVHTGPRPGEHLLDWITALEFKGRELRNQVGPSAWLDTILDSCRQIRKGTWPSDLFVTMPSILSEMPWLKRFERMERLPAFALENQPQPEAQPVIALPELGGVEEARLGPDGSLTLIGPLDGWMPEARGSSARVVSGILKFSDNRQREAAIKLMRMDKVSYALPLFREEVQVLAVMKDVPGIAHLLECGFLLLDEGAQLPLDSNVENAPASGLVVRLGVNVVREFLDQIEARIKDGWIPYIAIEKQKQEDSLLMLCDAGMTRGQYLPMVTLLQMSVQICDILQIAHQRKIVYRDHKILHYYWQPQNNGIYIIDWNVARYHPEGLTEVDIHMDLVQFGARGLHHILTGRTAPGALPLGPTRPEEIEQAAQSYQTQWTYDDQRLSGGLRTVLERVLAGEYVSATALGLDLKRTMIQLPDARL